MSETRAEVHVRRHRNAHTHTASATCSGSMTSPCNSRVALTRVRTLSLTCLMAFSTMPTDVEFCGACAIALTPKRSVSSLITASRNANTAGSVSELTINSGSPSLFNDSTVSLIAAWSSTPLHCLCMLGLTVTTNNEVAPLVFSPSSLDVGSSQSMKNP